MCKCTPMPAKKQQAQSHAKMRRQKVLRHRHIHRNGQRHSTQNQKTQLYPKAQTKSLALNRERNGTGALNGHSHTVTREQQKRRLHGGKWHTKKGMGAKLIQAPQGAVTTVTDYRKGRIHKHSKKVQENGTKKGVQWVHRIDTGRDAAARSHKVPVPVQ